MAENAPKTPEDVARICDERDVRFIRLWFTDILGQLKSFSINRQELDDAFEGGMGFDGSSITGFNAIEESDMIAMPDPSTFDILPWRPEDKATGRMFCDVQVPGGEPYEGDPRWVMRRALERVRGWASTSSTSAPSSSTSTSARRTPATARRRCSTRAATSISRRSTPDRTCAARPCSRWSSSASTSSTRTTRSAHRSTRSTCASPTR